MFSRYEQEWQYRKAVMEAIMEVLRDGKPRTTMQILHSLPYGDGLKVNKKLVNSILFSEAKRYVWRDNNSYTWRLRPADEEQPLRPPWDLVRNRIVQILKYTGRQTVSELKEELELDGMPVPKWMIKAILSEDNFRFAVSTADDEPIEQEPQLNEHDKLWEELLEDF